MAQDPDAEGYMQKLIAKQPGWTYQDILPTAQDPQGNTHFSPAAGIVGAALSPIALLEKILAGKTPAYVPGTETNPTPVLNPELAAGATQTAMNMLGGSVGNVAPKGSLGMFLGWKSKGADIEALDMAVKMAKAGQSRESIWDQTGWFRAEDGHWKYEVPDYHAEVNPAMAERGRNPSNASTPMRVPHPDSLKNGPLYTGDVLFHDELYHKGQYPDPLHNIPVKPTDVNSSNVLGSYDPSKDYMEISRLPQDKFRATLLHELQHAIQTREGFNSGANPNDFLDKNYWPTVQHTQLGLSDLYPRISQYLPKGASFTDKITLHEGMSPAVQADVKKWNQLAEFRKLLSEHGQEAFRQYRNNFGERESRNTEFRSRFTPEELKHMYPWNTIGPME